MVGPKPVITTIDPSKETVLERIPYMEPLLVDAHLSESERAARTWARTGMNERAELLAQIAVHLRGELDGLARCASIEMGKPITQARAEVEKCAWTCDYFAAHAREMLAEQRVESAAAKSYVAFRPLGVLFAIMPWNFPFWQFFRAAAPALMAGNAIVLKHAENTTRCALEIERVIAQSGAQRGLVRTLLISNDDADRLIADPRITAVTLTGSERAGVAVATAAGAALKKCVLELGGSDAFVVLADADLEHTAEMAVKARFQNNGQSCIAAKRFIVEKPVHDAFLARFVERTRAQRVGDPLDERTDVGPLARRDLRETLHEQVRETLAAGARLACGGKAVDTTGYYYEPTIVEGVAPGMRMFGEEVFGPAAAVVTARDAAHAIELANDSTFGLGFSIWTSDTARAEHLARDVEAGSVFVNGMVASDPRLPFGGVKKSGYGRELSAFGIHEFVNVQTVWIGP